MCALGSMTCPVRCILSLRTGSIQLDFNKARTESTCGPEQPLALPDVLCQNCSFDGNLASAGPIISSPPKALFLLNESADTGMYDSDVAFSVRVGVRDAFGNTIRGGHGTVKVRHSASCTRECARLAHACMHAPTRCVLPSTPRSLRISGRTARTCATALQSSS